MTKYLGKHIGHFYKNPTVKNYDIMCGLAFIFSQSCLLCNLTVQKHWRIRYSTHCGYSLKVFSTWIVQMIDKMGRDV